MFGNRPQIIQHLIETLAGDIHFQRFQVGNLGFLANGIEAQSDARRCRFGQMRWAA
jgi:hypothetical protein